MNVLIARLVAKELEFFDIINLFITCKELLKFKRREIFWQLMMEIQFPHHYPLIKDINFGRKGHKFEDSCKELWINGAWFNTKNYDILYPLMKRTIWSGDNIGLDRGYSNHRQEYEDKPIIRMPNENFLSEVEYRPIKSISLRSKTLFLYHEKTTIFNNHMEKREYMNPELISWLLKTFGEFEALYIKIDPTALLIYPKNIPEYFFQYNEESDLEKLDHFEYLGGGVLSIDGLIFFLYNGIKIPEIPIFTPIVTVINKDIFDEFYY